MVVDAKLNDQALEGNKSGEFVLSLKEGKNVLIVSAQDQNEKVVSKKVTIQYKKEAKDEDPPKLLDQVVGTKPLIYGGNIIEDCRRTFPLD